MVDAQLQRTDDLVDHQTRLVIVPTIWEWAAISLGKRPSRPDLAPQLGEGAIQRTKIVRCGMGSAKAARLASRLNKQSVSEVTLLGVCGGLVPGLNVGDIVCGTSTVERSSGDELSEIDTLMHDRHRLRIESIACTNNCRVHFGAVFCASRVITATEKRNLAGDSRAIAVEMESAPLARWAKDSMISFSHVRVVIDAWDSQPLMLSRPLEWIREIRGFPKLREAYVALKTLHHLAREIGSTC